jgi:hypothetical protein
MRMYKPAYIVTCASGNEFVVKQLYSFDDKVEQWKSK